jgi:outer membrane protein OmpA-like peptidoglycan-associated protein/tetratricopeptide (TPR) repeat protein
MKGKKIYFLFFFVLLFCNTSKLLAQENNAQNKVYQKALAAFELKDFPTSIKILESLLEKNQKNAEASLFLFQVYSETKQYEKSITRFEKLIEIDSNIFLPYIVKYASEYAILGNYTKAAGILQEFKNKNLVPSYLKSKAAELLTICRFAQSHPTQSDIKVTNAGDSINTADAEYFPSITVQDSLFLFMRRINFKREDFYASILRKNRFSKASPLPDDLNIAEKKGSMSLTQDLNTLYYAADYNEKGFGRYDIYKVTKTKKGWSEPKNLGKNINSDYWESSPSIAPDNQALYFSSNRPGGYGGIDIYVAYKNEKGYFEEAINMGPTINTAGDEQSPFIHADNKTLYFSSNGWPGFGGADLFVIRKKIDGNWSSPLNLGYPINTFDNEGSIAVAGNGLEGYIASDRADSRGSLDIYKVILAANTRPNKTFYINGYIADALTKKPIAGEVVLINTSEETNTMQIKVDSSGNFILGLPYLDSIGIRVNSKGHEFASTILSLENINNLSGSTLNFYLAPIVKTFTKNFNNIFFEINKASLNKKSFVELDALITYLQSAPTALILIEGHTDNRGDSVQNQLLSLKRANTIATYLISKGIDTNRIKTIGLGGTTPIEDNATEEGRIRNRRTSFTITIP